ncbi:MAG: DUF1934 domain-containing protein [Oscillospiraceae bacterium]|nr:DUF1934 domain-containing protein [Oscillospiraceae bacterium]
MMKDVVIYIRTLFGTDGEEQDSIDFTTDGLYTYDGDTACLTYLETDVTGMEGTRTSVMVMPDKVVVDRDGTVTSRMVFRPGEKHAFLYDTPVGSATMHMDTRGLSSRFNEHGGHMEIDYVMDMEHAFASRNRFHLTVKEQKQARRDTNHG